MDDILKDLSVTLSRDDLDTLIDAAEDYKNKGAMGDMMGEMIVGMLSKNMPEEEKAKIEAEKKEKARKREEEKKAHEMKMDLLKAKLVLVREAIRTSDFAKNSKKLK